MRAPIGIAQFIGNQQVGGFRIGDAQERLGKRQQRCALFGPQPVFLQELIDPAIGLRVAQRVQ